jgi:hypothetical protein
VEFPKNARKVGVEPDVLHNLAVIYLPTVGLLYGTAIVCLFAFRIDKAKHEDNLQKLKEAAALIDPDAAPNQSPGSV